MILVRQEIGDVLRDFRLQKGHTLRQVAGRASVALGYLSEVERGQKEASSEILAAVAEALDILRWAPQAASEPVAKVIASAAANAQNNDGLDPATLVVATIYADGGPTAKRIRPRAQGRAFRIRKRSSHITVIVESRPPKQKGGASTSTARTRRAQGSKAAAAKATDSKEGSE